MACDLVGVRPDLTLLGKALGGGIIPVSAVVGSRSILEVLHPGEHGSTFGGNPLASAVGLAVVKLLATGEFQERSRVLGAQLRERLDGMIGHGLVAVRSAGLWAGLDVDPQLATGRQVCEQMQANGALAKDTHGSTLRLAPPLVATPEEIDWLADQLEKSLSELQKA